jgi:arylsulfatase A-like enzyme
LPPAPAAPKYTEDNRVHGGGVTHLPLTQVNPTYAAMIETMDTNVGRLMAKLEELGIDENTFVLFTSDNGGHLVTSNQPLRGCKGWLYEGGVRVPWIVRWPGVTVAGSECDVPVTNTDILPTVLDVCGVTARPPEPLDGISLVPLLRGDVTPVHDALFWHFPHYGNHGSGPCSSVRAGDWKLIEWLEGEKVELYDLAADPAEKTNLVTRHPDIVRRLREQLRVWWAETDANMPRPPPRR